MRPEFRLKMELKYELLLDHSVRVLEGTLLIRTYSPDHRQTSHLYLRGFPTRWAVANILATVSRSFGFTAPGGMRIRVRSSSVSTTSPSAIESTNPDDTSGVFSSITSVGL